MRKDMEEFACYNVEKWWHELNIFLKLTTFKSISSILECFSSVTFLSPSQRYGSVNWSALEFCCAALSASDWLPPMTTRNSPGGNVKHRHLRGRWQWERRGACSELSRESCYWNVALQPSHLRRWGCAPTCFLQRTGRKWTTGCSKKSETKPIARVFIWQDIINSG